MHRSSSCVVKPYPDLISIVVVPNEIASLRSFSTLCESASSDAARVAETVVAIPDAEYFSPRARAANSALRSPAKIK